MSSILDDTAWMVSAACRGMGPQAFFTDKPDDAKAVCAKCPVRVDCRMYAVQNDCDGIWGGTTQAEREQRGVMHPSLLPSKPRNGLTEVIDALAEKLGEQPWALTGKSRQVPLVHHRQVAFAVCRRVTDCSLPTIAKAFNRDHTTVMHGIRQAESDPKLRTLVDRIAAQISSAEARA